MKYSALKLFILSGIVFLAGVCISSAVICLVSDEVCEGIVMPFTQFGDFSRREIILNFVSSAARPLILMWFFGFTRFSLYADILALTYKGCVFGSVIAGLYRVCGLREGFLLALSGILPQNIPYIFVLLFMSVLSYEFSVCKLRTKKSVTAYFCILAFCIAICFLCGFFDAYITSAFLNFRG